MPNIVNMEGPLYEMWDRLVPTYKSRVFQPLQLKITHTEDLEPMATAIAEISERRGNNRINNYMIPGERDRVRSKIASGKDSVSIRFGHEKKGHGYHGERGDFCLVAGTYAKGDLTLFYRSLELIGGLAYDLVLINHLRRDYGLTLRTLKIWAIRSHTFALRGNSNEALYPKLRAILRSHKRPEAVVAGGIY